MAKSRLYCLLALILVACTSQQQNVAPTVSNTAGTTTVAQVQETRIPRATSTTSATSTVMPSSTPVPATRVPATTIPPTRIPATAVPMLPTANVEAAHVFPVQPASAVNFGSCHHDYPASDIFTPIGSEFVAVTDGVVDFVSYQDRWDPATDDPAIRGGLSVAIIGDDGVRYYGSHLSAIAEGIAVGERVNTGDVLGLTGNSGDARFTDPHVHFGISPPTTPADWRIRRGTINPYPYLLRWLDGENATPNLADAPSGAC